MSVMLSLLGTDAVSRAADCVDSRLVGQSLPMIMILMFMILRLMIPPPEIQAKHRV